MEIRLSCNTTMMTLIGYAGVYTLSIHEKTKKQESLAMARMARDDPTASSTASTRRQHCAAVLLAAMRGKVGSEFET